MRVFSFFHNSKVGFFDRQRRLFDGFPLVVEMRIFIVVLGGSTPGRIRSFGQLAVDLSRGHSDSESSCDSLVLAKLAFEGYIKSSISTIALLR